MDKRSLTSAVNGAKGGRPKEALDDLFFEESHKDEVWRPIPEHDGYFASSMGRVLSIKSGRPRVLKEYIGNGYPRVHIQKDGRQICPLSHRMVLMAFRGMPEDGMTASHLDGIRTNNNIENLVWESMSDNISRREYHGTNTHGERNGCSKLKTEDINYIRATYKKGEPRSAKNLSEKFGVDISHIYSIIRGTRWRVVASGLKEY